MSEPDKAQFTYMPQLSHDVGVVSHDVGVVLPNGNERTAFRIGRAIVNACGMSAHTSTVSKGSSLTYILVDRPGHTHSIFTPPMLNISNHSQQLYPSTTPPQ